MLDIEISITKTPLPELLHNLHNRHKNSLAHNVWAKFHEEDLIALEQRCKAHWTQTSPLLKSDTLPWIISFVGAAVVCGLMANDISQGVVFLMFSTLLVRLLMGLASGLCNSIFAWDAAEDVLKALDLLSSNPADCKHALALVKAESEIMAYRDSILSTTGRQLRAFDLWTMEYMNSKIRMARKLAKLNEACKELHAISTLSSEETAPT